MDQKRTQTKTESRKMVVIVMSVVASVLVTHCSAMDAEEFNEVVGACGYSPNQVFSLSTDALLYEFPWMAQLFFTYGEGERNNVYCEETLSNVAFDFLADRIGFIGDEPENSHSFGEGTLISPNFVLTTAQCLTLPPLLEVSAKLSFVRLGKWDLNSTSIFDVSVAKYMTHEQYDVTTGLHDIGLVKLQSNVMYTDFIRAVCLPVAQSFHGRTYEGYDLITSGWGETENEKCSHRRQKAKTRIVRLKTCTEIFENVLPIDHSHICAGGHRPYDTCSGNIGAPLMVEEYGAQRFIQIGLLFRRERACERTGIPAVYLNINTYLEWILAKMERPNIIISP